MQKSPAAITAAFSVRQELQRGCRGLNACAPSIVATHLPRATKIVELSGFLTNLGMAEKTAAKMAGRAHLQGRNISTLQTNYDGLVAILGAEGALEAVSKCYGLLETPPGTTSGAQTVYVDIMGAENAAEAIRKRPSVLMAFAGTIKGAHAAAVRILGADKAAAAIHKAVSLLRTPGDTILGTHKEIVHILGDDRAAAAILQSPTVLRGPADTVKGASEALAAHLGKAGMLLAVSTNPTVLRHPSDKIHQTAVVIKGLLGDSEGADLLKERPRLFGASRTMVEENVETLCDAFDREHVLKAVRVRSILLYDRTTAKKATKTGALVPDELRELVYGKLEATT